MTLFAEGTCLKPKSRGTPVPARRAHPCRAARARGSVLLLPNLALGEFFEARRRVHDECLECCKEIGCCPQTLCPTAVGGKGGAVERISQPGAKGCFLLDDIKFGSNKIITKYKSNVVGKRGQLNTLPLNCGWCHQRTPVTATEKKSIHFS